MVAYPSGVQRSRGIPVFCLSRHTRLLTFIQPPALSVVINRHIRIDLILDERIGDNALIDDAQEIVTPMNWG